MREFIKKFQSPVKRQGAERNVLLTLISFAASVIITRSYLTITHFPQIGGDLLHIAHVVWGGLLLFAAAILPLIFTNRRFYLISAVLAGAGMGLFIDEVGKFITQTNDYFFQPAATIIYAFFLLTVLLYLQVKKPSGHSARKELYHALDILEEFLDNDLDRDEYNELVERLEKISKETTYPELTQLAKSIRAFLRTEHIKVSKLKPTTWERIELNFQSFERKFLRKGVYKSFLIVAISLLAAASLGNLILLVRIAISQEYFQTILMELVDVGTISGNTQLVLFILRLMLEGVAGLLFALGLLFFVIGKDKRAIYFSSYGLLFSLTTINLLAFYFDQFRAVFGSLAELLILLSLLRFQLLYHKQRMRYTLPEA